MLYMKLYTKEYLYIKNKHNIKQHIFQFFQTKSMLKHVFCHLTIVIHYFRTRLYFIIILLSWYTFKHPFKISVRLFNSFKHFLSYSTIFKKRKWLLYKICLNCSFLFVSLSSRNTADI